MAGSECKVKYPVVKCETEYKQWYTTVCDHWQQSLSKNEFYKLDMLYEVWKAGYQAGYSEGYNEL